jgi:glycosyltransferase involved in cell wall biosynthesis
MEALLTLPEGFRLSVVIPVYNEAQTIVTVIERVRAVGLPCEIIVVDDASTDGTRETLAKLGDAPDLIIIRQTQNQGKGAALKAGFLQARGDVVLVQDADLEYDPAEYPKLIRPIIEDRADVVYGSRFLESHQSGRSHAHFLANRALTAFSNWFTKLNLTDMETCYKAFRGDVLQKLAPTLVEPRFGIEPELTAKLARLPNIRVMEVPISYAGRSYSEGKKIGWRDGCSAVRCIVKYGLFRN